MDFYHIVLIVFALILGVAVGSFVNVLVFRLRSGAHIGGRSKCMSCAKTLMPRMLVPLFSFIYQRGRCVYCKTRLSYQYPLVELALGLLYVAILLVHQFDPLKTTLLQSFFVIADVIIWTTLLAITAYDLRHKIIPDTFSLLFAVVAGSVLLLKWNMGLLPEYYIPFVNSVPWWIDLAAGPLLALPFALLWFFSGGRAMGLGDAKLAWGMGWFLGFPYAVSAVILSFWVAFIPSLFLLFLSKRNLTMKSEIPFAPFLVIGTFLVYAFHINILTWAL